MKIKIQVEALSKALGDVNGIVERKNITPILSNVMIKGEHGSVSLYTTDNSLYITKTIDAEILAEGETTVPAGQLFDTIKKLNPKNTIELSLTGNHLMLSCGGFKGKLPVLPTEDFPKDPHKNQKTSNNKFKIKLDVFKFLINKTRHAISLDESRYFLNGIYFHKAEKDGTNLLRAVATDGHRLALAENDLPAGAEDMPSIIIPRKTVEELHKINDKITPSEEVEITVESNIVSFKYSSLLLTSNVIEGNFPDYNPVIPTVQNHTIEVDTEELKSAIDLVSTFSEEKIRAVKLHAKESDLIVSATKENGLSEGEQSIPLITPCEDILISFNSKYLIDILNLIENKSAKIILSSSTAPALIKDKDTMKDLFVIMPMRL